MQPGRVLKEFIELQVKMFGDYTRWAMDVAAPDVSVPARSVLTTVDQAFRQCMGPLPGPVHLNCQYREPLGSAADAWPQNSVLQVVPQIVNTAEDKRGRGLIRGEKGERGGGISQEERSKAGGILIRENI